MYLNEYVYFYLHTNVYTCIQMYTFTYACVQINTNELKMYANAYERTHFLQKHVKNNHYL